MFQTLRHVDDVRQHAAFAQNAVQPNNRPMRRASDRVSQQNITLRRCSVPMPCVVERAVLRLFSAVGGVGEKDVVIRVRVERRVKIDQVNAFVSPLLHPFKAVAVI